MQLKLISDVMLDLCFSKPQGVLPSNFRSNTRFTEYELSVEHLRPQHSDPDRVSIIEVRIEWAGPQTRWFVDFWSK